MVIRAGRYGVEQNKAEENSLEHKRTVKKGQYKARLEKKRAIMAKQKIITTRQRRENE